MKMKYMLSMALISTIGFVSTGCFSGKLDVQAYPKRINDKVNIPEICEAEYKSVMPRVAVIDFTNNSTFGKAVIADGRSTTNSVSASVSQTNRAGVNLGIVNASTSRTATVGASHSKTNSHGEVRSVDAKLSKSIVPLMESKIKDTGGAKLFSRSDMNKIDSELKYQDSGLLDPNTVVKMGKTAGIQFLITGSIDNVEQTYRDNEAAAKGVGKATQDSEKQAVRLLGALAELGASMTDGMIIKTAMTVKILDVETGKIVFTKTIEESSNIGKIPNPTFDQVIGGIKSAIVKALPQLDKDFSRYFSVKGYIKKLRANNDGEKIAQISIGRDYQLKKDQILNVYIFEENEDPMTGKKECDRIQTNITLKASDQIEKDSAWVRIENPNGEEIKLLQLIQKTHKKDGFALPSL